MEQQLSQTWCFISIKRHYEVGQVLEQSISVAICLPGCSAALGPAATMLSVLDLNRFVLASHWQDLPLPFFIALF